MWGYLLENTHIEKNILYVYIRSCDAGHDLEEGWIKFHPNKNDVESLMHYINNALNDDDESIILAKIYLAKHIHLTWDKVK